MASSDIRVPFATTRNAAYSVGLVAQKALGRRLTHLPYNRFDKLLDSTWWLSTSSEVPAYRHGKIAFTHDYFGDDMFVGLYVEKGLERELAELAFPGRRYGIDSTWLWHSFVQALLSGSIARICDQIVKASAHCATVAIDGGTPGDDFDFVRFEYKNGSLSCIEAGKGKLSALAKASTVEELGQDILNLPKLGSLWLDFHAGFVFSAEGEIEWTETSVWENVCGPWKDWLR